MRGALAFLEDSGTGVPTRPTTKESLPAFLGKRMFFRKFARPEKKKEIPKFRE